MTLAQVEAVQAKIATLSPTLETLRQTLKDNRQPTQQQIDTAREESEALQAAIDAMLS